MGNLILGFPNRIDGALITGGAWVGSLPLSNLLDRAFARVARSVDLGLGSTVMVVDFQQQRTIRIAALIAHNLTFGARLRFEFANTDDFASPVLDIFTDAWPSVAGADWSLQSLEWENDNFWLGSYVQEDVEGQTPIFSVLLPEDVFVRYVRISIDDTGNPDGFVEVGRLFFGAAFLEPEINYDFGGSLGYEDATTVETSLSGAEYFDRREPIRVMRFSLSKLSKAEGFGRALELMRRAGTSGEVFVIADPEEEEYSATRNFLGRFRQLNPLEQLSMLSGGGSLNTMAFEIKELR